jgi:ribose-phosphate pyrophosphokinase
MALIGDVRGKHVLIPDDMIATGSSLCEAASFVKANGACDVYACATHGVFSGDAMAKLEKVGFKEIVVTNTIPLAPEKKIHGIKVLSIARIFGEAIQRIHEETSVSSLFV